MIFITSYSLSHKSFHVKKAVFATQVSEGLLINNWFSNNQSQKTVALQRKNKPSSSEEHASVLLCLLLTFVTLTPSLLSQYILTLLQSTKASRSGSIFCGRELVDNGEGQRLSET